MTILDMVREAHENSVAHGFWEGRLFDIAHVHPSVPKNIHLFLGKLMLIVTEVAEAAEVLREWGHMREVSQVPDLHDREHFGEELADILIRVGDLAGALDLDLDRHVREKMARNRARAYKHGKEA